jgi:hypothetical protein
MAFTIVDDIGQVHVGDDADQLYKYVRGLGRQVIHLMTDPDPSTVFLASEGHRKAVGGGVIPATWVAGQTLDQLRDTLIEIIKAHRQYKLESVTRVNYLGIDLAIGSNSRQNWLGLVTAIQIGVLDPTVTPVDITSWDEKSSAQITTATEAYNGYGLILNAVMTERSAAAAAIDSVLNVGLTTEAEIRAAADAYLTA